MAALSLIPGTAAALGGGRADFYLVERPRELLIYDRYQQTVRDPAAAGILPFVPLRVLAWEDFMGDGFTPCTRVEVDGKTYFLIRDAESRRLVGQGRMGRGVIVRDAEIVDDTVALRSGRRIEFDPPAEGERAYLTGGTQIARLFRTRGRTYARLLRQPARFGWLAVAEEREGSVWVRVHPTAATTTALAIDPRPRVQAAANEANEVLRTMYRLLNRLTRSRGSPPRWEVARSDSEIICTLRGAESPERYQETSTQLAKRIERQLLGTPYAVIVSTGSILVVRR